jgi:methylated-DNA-[protein]-cysteine S-methyltransferase
MYATTVPTPVGPFSLVVVDDGVVAAGFAADPADLEMPTGPLTGAGDLATATAALRAYFDGDLHALDSVPVRRRGGAFRVAAWDAMRRVPPGQTVTYTELAAAAGNPRAARAAGAACAQNLVPLVVPCHRVVRSDASLGGYYYGLPVKRWLLAHEGAA